MKKFAHILDVFSLIFTKYKVKKYKQTHTQKRENPTIRAKEKETLTLCSFCVLCALVE